MKCDNRTDFPKSGHIYSIASSTQLCLTCDWWEMTLFLLRFFYRDDISYAAAFQLCPDTQYTICSQFNSWVMGVKVLAQGNNSSREPQLGIESGTLQLPGRCPGSLLLHIQWSKYHTSRTCMETMHTLLSTES